MDGQYQCHTQEAKQEFGGGVGALTELAPELRWPKVPTQKPSYPPSQWSLWIMQD